MESKTVQNERITSVQTFEAVRSLTRLQRVMTASRPISDRRFLDNFFALAGPPFSPPSLPNATAAGFLSLFGFLIESSLLERLGMNPQ